MISVVADIASILVLHLHTIQESPNSILPQNSISRSQSSPKIHRSSVTITPPSVSKSGTIAMDKKPKDDEVLPSDLISEILYRLPVKLLCRFRLVCKPWNQLISTKDFQDKHYQRLAEQGPLLLTACPDFIDEDTPPKRLDLTIRDSDDGTNIKENFSVKFPSRPASLLVGPVQYCRGLVCLSYADSIFLMNPSTREVIALPQFELLAHCTGFGYDEVKDEFKVVRFFTTDKSRCAVFCLGSEGWREVACPPLSYAHDNYRAPMVNGAVHVLSDSKNPYEEAAVYGFNIQTEEFAKITLPADYYVAKAEAISMNELRGCLCMTFSFETNMDVWMLKDYGNEVWEKVYTIEAESTDFLWGEPLLATGDGTILLQIFDEERDLGELHRYDPDDGEYYEKVDDNCTATLYVESLFPLGGGPDLDESSDSDGDDDEDDDDEDVAELSDSDDDDEDDDELSDSDDDEN